MVKFRQVKDENVSITATIDDLVDSNNNALASSERGMAILDAKSCNEGVINGVDIKHFMENGVKDNHRFFWNFRSKNTNLFL